MNLANNLRGGVPMATPVFDGAHENEIKGISVSRDEQYLLSCSEDG